MYGQIFNFTVTSEYSFSKRVSAVVQLDGGTPRLKGTGLEEWDGVPLDWVMGVRGDVPVGRFASPFFWQAALSEDLRAVGPSVDVSFWFSVGVRFPTGHQQKYQGDFFASR